MTLQIKDFFDKDTETFTYVIIDSLTKHAAIIDPVANYNQFSGVVSYVSADAVLDYVFAEGLQVKWILETHIHADHLTAAAYLKEKLGAKIGVGSKISEVLSFWIPLFNIEGEQLETAKQFDQLFADQDIINLGNLTIKVLHTPGHTPACVSYLVEDAIFVGDTIFMPDVGTARADFPGGDSTTLYHSIKKILELPANMRIFVCHDYAPASRSPECMTTVAQENEKNIFINKGVAMQEFVTKRNQRDKGLAVPKLLYPSLQVNIRAGGFGSESSNGKKYIKVPIKFA